VPVPCQEKKLQNATIACRDISTGMGDNRAYMAYLGLDFFFFISDLEHSVLFLIVPNVSIHPKMHIILLAEVLWA